MKRRLHIFEDGASGVQVGDIEQGNHLKLVQNMIKLHYIDGFLQSFVMMPSLQQTLSIPTMVSMATCPKELSK